MGGTNAEIGGSVALDSAGNLVVSGSTGSANFPVLTSLQSTLKGGNDDFVAKVSPGAPPPPVAGVTITQSGGSTDVAEGGATDTYTAVLNTAPTGNVTITLNPGTQVTVAPGVLTFTVANWNVPQTVTVTAVDDALVEGPHTGTITHTAVSADPAYNGVAIASVVANITDNDGVPPPPPGNNGNGEGTYQGSKGIGGPEGAYGFGGGMRILDDPARDGANQGCRVRNVAYLQDCAANAPILGGDGLMSFTIAGAALLGGFLVSRMRSR